MPQRVPATVGDPLDAIDTPALVVDLEAFEANLDAYIDGARRMDLRVPPSLANPSARLRSAERVAR